MLMEASLTRAAQEVHSQTQSKTNTKTTKCGIKTKDITKTEKDTESISLKKTRCADGSIALTCIERNTRTHTIKMRSARRAMLL